MNADDIVRFVLRGEYAGTIDEQALLEKLNKRFFCAQLVNRVTIPSDIWEGREANSLRGIFLDKMKKKYDEAESSEQKESILLAVRYGLAALDRREEWSPTC